MLCLYFDSLTQLLLAALDQWHFIDGFLLKCPQTWLAWQFHLSEYTVIPEQHETTDPPSNEPTVFVMI